MDCACVGSFIAKLRRERNLTQQELADRIGVTNKAVSKWETGEGYPEITLLPQLADALGVTADELLRGERAADRPGQRGTNDAASLAESLSDAALLKFRNMWLLSLSLAAIGLVAFFVITLTSFYEVIGFGVQLALLLCSILIFATSYNTLMQAKRACDARCSGAAERMEMAAAGGRALVISIFIWLAGLLPALPYIVLDDGVYTQGILAYHEYIRVVPVFLVLGGGLSFFASRIVADTLGLGSAFLRLPFETKELRGAKARHNAISLLIGMLLAASYAAAVNSGAPSVTGILIIFTGALGYAVFCVIYLLGGRRGKYRGIVAYCSVRNLAAISLAAQVISRSIQYVSTSPADWQMVWVEGGLLAGFMIALTVFCVLTAALWLYEYRAGKTLPGTRV